VGSSIINVINIDNWENPANDLEVTSYYLKANNPSVLYVPGGHVTGIKALKSDASLIVFSDMLVKESEDDDLRFNKNKWFNWNSV
jgi:dTDP-4-dehydrorhamnose 3,5-epimerase-like enzyme